MYGIWQMFSIILQTVRDISNSLISTVHFCDNVNSVFNKKTEKLFYARAL